MMAAFKRDLPDASTEDPIFIDEHFDLSRLRELVYWSQEPGLLELMRAVLTMPQASLSDLLGFLRTVPAAAHLCADYAGDGAIRLSVARRHS
ncbi:hypothetical protein [Phreatobacter sp. AB_2022a]|uniref:hypothetical protein n=1 Tax=Phreatobacter sp. AB_2022a TaxID=3003134 RepID=UPI002287166C|nr:hypothetical protein [Phreatobacter sp. AB_2022a]MCZ0738330.1 hypothetical protein [Phreatobacter sp. AB_2022a]